MRRCLAAWFLSLAALATPLPFASIAAAQAPAVSPAVAPAAEQPSLFAVIAAPEDHFGQRVLAELESLGFQALRLDPDEETASRPSLEIAARKAGALAAIRAVASERGVEVWIADRVTGKTVLREITIERDVSDPESALAIRAVELLRASLLEVSLPGPPRGEVPAPPAVRRAVARAIAPPVPAAVALPAPPALRFSLEPGVLVSPGGVGAAAALDVGLAWMPAEHVGVSAFASLPLSRPRVSGAAGSAELATVLAGACARFVLTGRASLWSPSIDIGVTAILLQINGTASAGYTAHDVASWTGAPFLRAGLALAAHPMLRVRGDVLVTAIFQGAMIKLAGQPAATYGQPMALFSAGIDFGWF